MNISISIHASDDTPFYSSFFSPLSISVSIYFFQTKPPNPKAREAFHKRTKSLCISNQPCLSDICSSGSLFFSHASCFNLRDHWCMLGKEDKDCKIYRCSERIKKKTAKSVMSWRKNKFERRNRQGSTIYCFNANGYSLISTKSGKKENEEDLILVVHLHTRHITDYKQCYYLID